MRLLDTDIGTGDFGAVPVLSCREPDGLLTFPPFWTFKCGNFDVCGRSAVQDSSPTLDAETVQLFKSWKLVLLESNIMVWRIGFLCTGPFHRVSFDLLDNIPPRTDISLFKYRKDW